MGFRTGAYAKVWSVENTGRFHKVNLSVSRKDKNSGEYVTDFSGFVAFVGGANLTAANLQKGDRIKIGDCDVTTSFNKEKHISYTNYTIFSYEMADGTPSAPQPTAAAQTTAPSVTPDEDPF